MDETYYRYNDPIFFIDESPSNQLELSEYKVLSRTTCGVWIKYPERDRYLYSPIKYIEGKKFILEKSIYNSTITRKRFAWPTKEEALASYKHRKQYQINILERQLEQAKENLYIASNNIVKS